MTKFHKSDKFVRAILGPIGSGKSVACVMELFIKCIAQEPDAFSIRKSRFVIVRNTYRELIDTTINTFFDWIPQSLGIFKKMDMQFNLTLNLPDHTTVQAEFLFRALDKPDDIKKLLSLEVTGGWINECREIPKAIVDMLIGRLGRYPNKLHSNGATWFGLIMDTNPPDSDHWFYRLFEESCPDNYELFKQPSGLSPEAENIQNLPNNYYQNMQTGKDKEWVNVYVHGMYGFVTDGKPVFPEYVDAVHSSNEELLPSKTDTIYVGIDFGLTPAATFGYLTATQRWNIFDELVTVDMGADNFSKLLKRHILRNYPDNKILFFGDPAGVQRSQTNEQTPYDILHKNNINAYPAYTNDFMIRREAVAGCLSRLDFIGSPGIAIGSRCINLRKALAGGYKYKRMAVARAEIFADVPSKNKFSHVAESLQYLLLGGGEGDKVVGSVSSNDLINYDSLNQLII